MILGGGETEVRGGKSPLSQGSVWNPEYLQSSTEQAGRTDCEPFYIPCTTVYFISSLAALIAYPCRGMCVWCGILAQKGQLLHEPVQTFALECLSSCQWKAMNSETLNQYFRLPSHLEGRVHVGHYLPTCFVYSYLYCLTVLFNTLNYEFPTANNVYLPLLKPCCISSASVELFTLWSWELCQYFSLGYFCLSYFEIPLY